MSLVPLACGSVGSFTTEPLEGEFATSTMAIMCSLNDHAAWVQKRPPALSVNAAYDKKLPGNVRLRVAALTSDIRSLQIPDAPLGGSRPRHIERAHSVR